MTKPIIVLRTVKGEALTYAEHDANFTNLQDATVSLTAGSGGTEVISDLNGNITLVAGTNISLSGNNTAKTITITNTSPGGNSFSTIAVGATNVVADSTSDTLTLLASGSITLAANAGADSITIGSSASGTVNTGADGALAFYPGGFATTDVVDDTLISYSQAVGIQTLTAQDEFEIASGSDITLTAAINGDIWLDTFGTGSVTITNDSVPGNLNVASISNGGAGVIIDSGTVGITSTTDADIYITPNGTGKLVVVGDMTVGDVAAGAIITSNWNNTSSFLTLRARNSTTVGEVLLENANSYLKAGGAGTAGRAYIQAVDGDVHLQPKTSTGKVVVGAASGTGGTTITSFTTNDLVLNTNSGTNSGSITLTQGANANITITPNGTGKTVINNIVTTETLYNNGNSGAATITPNAANGSIQKYTLTGNITWNAFGTPVAGQSMTMLLVQDATGSRTLTSTMKFAGGSKTLSTAANATDIMTVYYDGSTYYASLSKGFA
jgi:hypothetical protein